VALTEDFYTCVLCGEKSIGWGNNPEPLRGYDDGRCCDDCNAYKVIPARIGMMMSDRGRQDNDDHDDDDDDQ
jgi:hypothetical protein